MTVCGYVVENRNDVPVMEYRGSIGCGVPEECVPNCTEPKGLLRRYSTFNIGRKSIHEVDLKETKRGSLKTKRDPLAELSKHPRSKSSRIRIGWNSLKKAISKRAFNEEVVAYQESELASFSKKPSFQHVETLDKTKLQHVSLRAVLNSRILSSALLAFTSVNHCSENIKFLIDIRIFKNLTDPDAINRKAMGIYAKYLTPQAPCWLCVPYELYDDIEKTVRDKPTTLSMFDDIYLHVYEDTINETLPRFFDVFTSSQPSDLKLIARMECAYDGLRASRVRRELVNMMS